MNTANFSFPERLQTPVAITNVNVIPMDRQWILKNQTVVIEDGWIKAVEPAPNIDTTHMQIVNGSGRYLLPGLSDMHVHYWMPGDAPLFLANGVTTVRNMSGAPFHLALQQQVNTGAFPGPRIVTTCPTLEADEHNLPMWKYVDSPVDAVSLVEQYATRGYQQIKVLNLLDADTLVGLGRACQIQNLRLTGHCPHAVTFEQAIGAGMSCFEHLHGIWKGHLHSGVAPTTRSNVGLEPIQAMANYLDYEAIRRLAGQMAEQQIWNCPTLIAEKLMRLPQAEGMAHIAAEKTLPYVPQIALPLWEMLDPSRFHANELDPWLDAVKGRWQAAKIVTRILHEEGAPLLVGTDTSVRFVVQGFSIHEELAAFISSGLTPFEAIRYATSESARFLGIDSEAGTIAKGKRADLLLVDENPLENISALRKLNVLFINGFYLKRRDLGNLLKQQAKAARESSFNLVSGSVDSTPGDFSGTLVELSAGKPKGRLHYRHKQLENDDWQIEEIYEFEQNSIYEIGGYRLRSTVARLNSDLTVRRAKVVEESFCGIASLEIEYGNANRYVIQQSGEDGFVSRYELDESDLLMPDISLLVTVANLPGLEDTINCEPEWKTDCRADQPTLSILPSIELERAVIGRSRFNIKLNSTTCYKVIHVVSHWGQSKLESHYHFLKDGQLESCQHGWSQFVSEQTTINNH